MKTRFLIFLMLMSGFTFQSCKQADGTATSTAPDMEQVKSEIQALEVAWAAAQDARDLDALMNMYTDDAMSMPDGAPTLSGKAAIRERQAKEFETAPEGTATAYTTLEVYGDADVVTEIGTGITKDAGGNVLRQGKYFAMWKKVDGKYLCFREIYNSDAPAK